MADTPVLDLTTERQRPFVRIDQRTFELRDHLDLSIFDSRLLQKWGARINELEALDSPTDAQRAEYLTLLRRVSRHSFVDQDEIAPLLEKLNEPQLKAIVTVFSTLLLPRLQQTRARLMEATAAARPQPGRRSSRSSSGSTGSRRSRGSARSRKAI